MRPRLKGCRLTGGYHIPYREAAAWHRRVKRCRKAALRAMRAFCPYALAQWAGSEDGEAVTGLDRKGELVAIVHLDAEGLDFIEKGLREGNLAQALQDANGRGDGVPKAPRRGKGKTA